MIKQQISEIEKEIKELENTYMYFGKSKYNKLNELKIKRNAILETTKAKDEKVLEDIRILRNFIGNCRFKISNKSLGQLYEAIEQSFEEKAIYSELEWIENKLKAEPNGSSLSSNEAKEVGA